MKKIRSLALAGIFAIVAARCDANSIVENFSTDPLQNGWQIFGDTNLFVWDSANQNLAVTWDSAQTNSYFYKPLGTVLAKADDFSIEFDLTLSDSIAVGYMELAVGLFNFQEATNQNFSRPFGNTPDLFEFDYFPEGPDSYGPSIDTSLADMTVNDVNESDFFFSFDTMPMENNITYHVMLSHAAGQDGITAEMLTNGQVFTSFPISYSGPIIDFRLDTISVSSYSTNGDFYVDSILAHGTVDNFTVTLPPVVRNFTGTLSNGVWQAQCDTYTNWFYSLERSTNLISWADASPAMSGTGRKLILSDTNPPADRAFYRVKAESP